jgi:hypothetical protein
LPEYILTAPSPPVTGIVNASSLSITVNLAILGISLGSFTGNLKDGLVIKVDLVALEGEVRFFIKNGNQVWVGPKLSVVFDGKYETEAKLVSI